jgi:hypothetical protein
MTRTSELFVIGARDITPPQGRVTVELRSASTGRLRKRVVVENALMDWYKAAVLRNGGRGSFEVLAPTTAAVSGGVNPLQYPQGNGQVTPGPGSLYALNYPDRWPNLMGVAKNMTNWLWATAANVAPDATKMQIPTVGGPEVTGGAKIDGSSYAADGIQNKRGALNLTLSGQTWDQVRTVVDFATGEGNGTYRSIGIGTLINERISPGGLRAFPPCVRYVAANTANTPVQEVSALFTTAQQSLACALGVNNNLWSLQSGFELMHFDLAQRSTLVNGTEFPVNTFTVTAGNVPGSGGPLGPVIQPTATDFWVARNQTLYRCVTPVANVAMTVLNTYNLAGTLGAEVINDIAFDGTNLYLLTDTRVYVVNPATGASTSNWLHGRTGGTAGYQTIEWDAAEQLLWINFVDRTTGGVARWGMASGSLIPLNQDSLICYGYTTAGTLTKWNMGRPAGDSSTATPGRQLNAMSPDGRFVIRIGSTGGATNAQELYGPSMASHALLPSDVIKTSDDTLRIIYDFNFA